MNDPAASSGVLKNTNKKSENETAAKTTEYLSRSDLLAVLDSYILNPFNA